MANSFFDAQAGDPIDLKNRLAMALLQQGESTAPVQSWTQGAARLAQALTGSYLAKQGVQQQKDAYSSLAGLLSGQQTGQQTGQPAQIGDAQPSSVSTPMAGALPRGYRNNNPLNIEDGSFAQSQPGYAGSDGRFAKFASLDQGNGAASGLLDIYNSKYGLNTIRGILSRWAPASDGNNVEAYAKDVATRLGVGPDDQLQPQQRQGLISAMAMHENGIAPPQGQQAPQVAQGPQVAQAGPPAQSDMRATIQRMLQSDNPYVQRQGAALAQTLIGQQLQPPQFHTIQGMFGQTPVWTQAVGPNGQPTIMPAQIGQQTNQQPIQPQSGTAATQPAQGGPPTLENFNPNAINSNLKGDDYLAQFPPEIQAAVKSYMSGGVMPTGNPRNQGISTYAKMVAQKYAMDIGNPNLADDSLYSQRRQLRTELGKSSPNSMGGILSNGKSAFGHLATLSDNYVAQGNYNGWNGPGGGLVANAENAVANTLGTSQTRGQLQQTRDNALKYGQESTKFYAGTGGGEGERMNALNSINPTTSSSAEMAGFLQSERDLMVKRMQEKEAQIRDTLGDQYLQQHPVFTPDLQNEITHIDGNIKRLRGGPQTTPQTASPQSNGLPQGWSVQVH